MSYGGGGYGGGRGGGSNGYDNGSRGNYSSGYSNGYATYGLDIVVKLDAFPLPQSRMLIRLSLTFEIDNFSTFEAAALPNFLSVFLE
jgi:hypothetical protein